MNVSKNPIFFVFLTVLIDCIGIGIIFPVMPSLITEVTGAGVNEAAKYGGWLAVSYSLMQFVCAPVLGALSDRYGRRPVLLIALLGLGVDYLFLAVAPTLMWFFVGRIIAGMCGASFTTAFAYVADVAAPEKRAQYFGMMGAAFGLGFIIGPFVGGLFSDMGPRAPFVAAAVLSLLNFLYGFFILPESLSADKRRRFEWKRANPFGAFAHLAKHKELTLLVMGMFMLYLAGQVMPAIWSFYTKYRFNWSDKEIGYSLAFVGVVVSVVQGGLIKWSQNAFGVNRAIYIGFCFSFVGLMLFTFGDQSWMMYVFTLVYAMGGIGPPGIQGILSARVPADEQGELQGLLTSLTSLATVLSPLLMTQLFYFFTSAEAPVLFPGVPFMAAAILIVFAALFVIAGLKKKVTEDVLDS